MAVMLTRVEPEPGAEPDVAVCAAGRWLTHAGWAGWQAECGEPGIYATQPPFVLCYWHAWDLGERQNQGQEE